LADAGYWTNDAIEVLCGDGSWSATAISAAAASRKQCSNAGPIEPSRCVDSKTKAPAAPGRAECWESGRMLPRAPEVGGYGEPSRIVVQDGPGMAVRGSVVVGRGQ
jgi:hypothetical protein